MLAQCWASIEPALGERPVFSGHYSSVISFQKYFFEITHHIAQHIAHRSC